MTTNKNNTNETSEAPLTKEQKAEISVDVVQAVADNDVETLVDFINSQAKALHSEVTYVETERDSEDEERLVRSYGREFWLHGLMRALNLCEEGNIKLPSRTKRKAHFALLRANFDRIEEFEDIITYGLDSSHLVGVSAHGYTVHELLKIAESETVRFMIKLGLMVPTN